MKLSSNSVSLRKLIVAQVGVALLIAAGCRDSQSPHGHSDATENPHGHEAGPGHDHTPPNGGTPVIVAEHKIHLELVHDRAAGKIQAYVLDGNLERYIPVPETNFVISATAGGGTTQLASTRSLAPGAERLNAKSSLFETQTNWLKTITEFEGSIPVITLEGATFTNITFHFPKGSKHVH